MNTPFPQSLKAYNRASHTVSKTRQVVMLYDGAVRFMQQACEAIEQKDYEVRYNRLMRVSEIMMGLQSCLDFEQGSKAAQTLYDFYSAMDARVMELHRSNDAEAARLVVAELKQMRAVWDKIDHGDMATQPSPVPMAAPDSGAAMTTIVSA